MRKTLTITGTVGRDAGKTYLLTEMSASRAEKLAARALLALTRAGVDIPDDLLELGFSALVALGLRQFGKLAYEDAEPLLDEMLGCVQFVPDVGKMMVTRPLIEDDIEELATRLFLRSEVVALHVGFSIAAELSKLRQQTQAT